MCPQSTHVIVRLTTRGQRYRVDDPRGWQNQPSVSTKPIPCLRAFAAIVRFVES
jgi:hypothetical protein